MTLQQLLQNPDYKQKFVLEKLIQEYLWYTREEMRLRLEDPITENVAQKIHVAYQDYMVHKKPLEYILWHVDFFWVPFHVNEHTLIPRPETEYMITAVSEHLTPLTKGGSTKEAGSSNQDTLLDIGTGCGVLGISVLLQNPEYFHEAYFSDISPSALEVAQQNYKNLIPNSESYHTHFLQSNLASFLPTISSLSGEGDREAVEGLSTKNLVLIANLPYIPDETFDNNALENVQKREPRLAFVGGHDGLDLYREMFNQLAPLMKGGEGGSKCKHKGWNNLTMFLEMMTRQVDILRQEFWERLEFQEVKTFHFNIRIVKARTKAPKKSESTKNISD